MPRKSKVSSRSFEPLRKNSISLRDDEPLDSHLKVLKIGGDNTPLSLSENEFRIEGDLSLEGKFLIPKIETDNQYLDFKSNSYFNFDTGTGSMQLYVASGDSYYITSANLHHFMLTSAGTFDFGYLGGNATLFRLDAQNTKFQIMDDEDTGDSFTIQVQEHGNTTISTTDDDATAAHLTLWSDGDLKLTPKTGIMYLYDSDNDDDYAKFTVGSNGDLTIETVDAAAAAANLTLDVDGRLYFNADGGRIIFQDGTATIGEVSNDSDSIFLLYNINDSGDFLRISTGSRANTLFRTTDGTSSTSGHITLQPDGDLVLNPASQKTIINATNPLFFDGGTHTYIYESSADVLDFIVGGDNALRLVEDDNQCLTLFKSSSAVFAQSTTTYNATDTDVNFRVTNKSIVTFGAGNITDIQLYFPGGSGNFVLLLKQDGTGSRTVTNWKAYDSAGNAANGSATVKWAGGSAPTLTTDANHVDILSFYWDATNEIAYGVATLDFQF